MSQPKPSFQRTVADEVIVVTSASDSYRYYGWQQPKTDSRGIWRYTQAWAVTPDMLLGLHTFEATGAGGDPKTHDFARVRFVFLPVTREMELSQRPTRLTGHIGRLQFTIHAATGQGWQTGEVDGNQQPPQPVSEEAAVRELVSTNPATTQAF